MTESPKTSAYVIGLITSFILTGVSFFLVVNHKFPAQTLTVVIVALAITQLIVQLIFFLHLGRERGPRWNLLVLSLAAIILLIVVTGSLWIMTHLNYNMSPPDVNNFVQKDEGIHY